MKSTKRKAAPAISSARPESRKYKYVMHVTETFESRCVIESGRKLTFEQLRRRAEKRRVDGKLMGTGSRTSRSSAKPPRKADSRTTTRSFEGRVAVKVTFIVFKGEVNAVFRAVKDAESGKWTKDGPFVNPCDGRWRYNAYAHVGQHCEVDASLLKCRRATYEEYAPLLAEMRDIVGYDVETVQHGKLRLKEERRVWESGR